MLKIISLWEPWASLMALKAKQIETRDWGTSFRGEVAIHATLGGLSQSELFRTCADEPFLSVLKMAGILRTGMGVKDVAGAFPRGKIIAVGSLIDSRTLDPNHVNNVFRVHPRLQSDNEVAFGNYGLGRFGLVFADVHVLRVPVPFKSRQGKLLDLDPDTERAVREQLANAAE